MEAEALVESVNLSRGHASEVAVSRKEEIVEGAKECSTRLSIRLLHKASASRLTRKGAYFIRLFYLKNKPL